MSLRKSPLTYTPGMYKSNRPIGKQLVENYFRSLEKKRRQHRRVLPALCISRTIGVGALEVADLMAEMLGYTVVDRQILEQIATTAALSQKTVEAFDERYPGKMKEFLTLLFGEKSFIPSDYRRLLTQTVLAAAGLQSTIFVGRGTHLILPRERCLAVHLVGSMVTRVERLVPILKSSREACRMELVKNDAEQAAFFKKIYGKKDSPAVDFDIVINRDYLRSASSISRLIEFAFKSKFGSEVANDTQDDA